MSIEKSITRELRVVGSDLTAGALRSFLADATLPDDAKVHVHSAEPEPPGGLRMTTIRVVATIKDGDRS